MSSSLQGRVGRGVAALSMETILSTLLQIVAAALVFRYLTVAAYGQLTLALSFYSSGAALVDFGLNAALVSEIAKARGERRVEQVKLYVWRYSAFQLVSGGIALIVSFFIGLSGVGVFKTLWPLMGLYLLATALNNIAMVVLLSYTRYVRHALQSFIRSLFRLLLLAALPYIWEGSSLVGVAVTYPLMEFLTALISLGMAWQVARSLATVPMPAQSWSVLWRMLLDRGLYSTLIVPIKSVLNQLPIWVLTAVAGSAAAGTFGAAQGGFMAIYPLFSGVETTLFPLASEQLSRDPNTLRNTVRQTQKYSVWASLVTAAGGWLMAPLFIRIIAGGAYAGAIPVFRTLLFLLVIYAFAHVQRPLFFAMGQQRALFLFYVADIVLYAVLLALGVVSCGALGAAWALIVSEALIVYLRQRSLKRHDPLLAFDLGRLFVINDFDRQLWQRLVQLLRHDRSRG